MKMHFWVMCAMGAVGSLVLQISLMPIALVIIAVIVQNVEMAITLSLIFQGLSIAGFAAIVKYLHSEMPITLNLVGVWAGYMATAALFALMFYVNVVTG